MAAEVPLPPVPQLFTVEDALIVCGISDAAGVAAVGRRSDADRLSEEMFDNSFESFMDMEYKNMIEDFKTMSNLTQNEGRIRLTLVMKRNIRGLLQWVKDEYRHGRDPSITQFNIDDIENLVRKNKTHDLYVEKSKGLASASEPEKFKTSTKWNDWKPTFLNYLRAIPGRDRIPLSYVVRENDEPSYAPQQDFLEEYVLTAPLVGDAFEIDTSEVRTYLMKYITGNENAEATVQALQNKRCGRVAFKALRDHYEGVGVYGADITRAERILNNLHYNGEKKPYMWWTEFEKQLTWAFGAYDSKEDRVVYSDVMRLRMLLRKVQADFLSSQKASIDVELSKVPMTYTYSQALQCFREAVTKKFPPTLLNESSTYRRGGRGIHNINTNRGGRFGREYGRGYGGRNSGRGYGYGRGGRGRFGDRPYYGRGNYGRRNYGGRGSNWINKKRNDSRIVTLIDGTKMELHPSFRLTDDEFRKLKREDYDWMINSRNEYKRKMNQGHGRLEVKMSRTENSEYNDNSTISTNSNPTERAIVPYQSSERSVNFSGSVMGGRNEQADMRRRNNNL